MQLKQWLKTTDFGVAQFAEEIGIARYTLQRYLHQGRLPPPEIMVEIHRATRGQVAPNDFYKLKKVRAKKS